MFPSKYVKGEDLKNKSYTLTIHRVKPEEMRPQPNAPAVSKFVIYFKGAEKGVILSRTLAEQIAEVVGSDDTSDWPGKSVMIYTMPMTVAGKDRIAIRARNPINGQSDPPPEMREVED
jgi:ubiquitin